MYARSAIGVCLEFGIVRGRNSKDTPLQDMVDDGTRQCRTFDRIGACAELVKQNECREFVCKDGSEWLPIFDADRAHL